MATQWLQGSCLCGEVRYQARDFSPLMAHCHCTMCRKFHGAAFATYAGVKAVDFQWLSGESLLSSFQADNGTQRQFCAKCGSSLTFACANANGEVVEFSLGTLDSALTQKPDAHIFVNYKADWFAISDQLPQHGEGRVAKNESS